MIELRRIWLTGCLLAMVASCAVHAAVPHHLHSRRALSSNVVVPQTRAFAIREKTAVQITQVDVGVAILEQVAATTMDISLRNPSRRRLEAELLVPVPDGAAVRGFSFQGAAKEPTAVLLPKDEARKIYNEIVAKVKDPALLEFAGYNVIRSSVFPVDAGGTQRVRLTYENLLHADGQRIDYILPRTEAVSYNIPWNIKVTIRSKHGVTTTYSPSHETKATRVNPNSVIVNVTKNAVREPGSFQLSYLTKAEAVAATLMAYPDPKAGGGYFMLLAAVPPAEKNDAAEPAVKRELTIVIDRSGSMNGEKIQQARAAALQVVNGLFDGEAFNIIDYASTISSFASKPVIKDKDSIEKARHYIRQLSSGGGTNLHAALIEALRQKPTDGMLPIVLFLTDGLPTVGVRSEVAIRRAAMKANAHKRRIFTFGVGYDVNAPLLTHIARKSRAVSTFLQPKEDVEVKVSQVYRRLTGPVLSEPKLATLNEKGEVVTDRVSDLMPIELPDVFEGDRLVVFGKYKSDKPLLLRLQGDYRGKPRTFRFEFKLDGATTKNSFVPRLWASRKIAFLIDEIRQAGAAEGDNPSAIAATIMTDPKMQELVDEIVRLSTEFGILTEYTAFLAREGTDLSDTASNNFVANNRLYFRGQRDRSKIGGVNQALNNNVQLQQTFANRHNAYYDRNMNRVQVSRVQQINDRAFFQRGNRWIDSQVVNSKSAIKPDRTIAFGSSEYMKLMDELIKKNRQGTLSLSGEILMRINDENILVK